MNYKQLNRLEGLLLIAVLTAYVALEMDDLVKLVSFRDFLGLVSCCLPEF